MSVRPFPKNLRKAMATRSAGIAVLVVGTISIFPTPAFAHHPEITGVVECAPSGDQVITWTVGNSESVAEEGGSGRTMTVDLVSVTSGDVSGISVGTEFPPKPTPGSTKTATTTVPGNQTGTVELTVRGDWAQGPQDVSQKGTVTLETNCVAATTTITMPATTTTTAPVVTATTLPVIQPVVLGVVEVAPPAPAPVPLATLPVTGSPIGSTAGLAIIAIGVGALALAAGRNKRDQQH